MTEQLSLDQARLKHAQAHVMEQLRKAKFKPYLTAGKIKLPPGIPVRVYESQGLNDRWQWNCSAIEPGQVVILLAHVDYQIEPILFALPSDILLERPSQPEINTSPRRTRSWLAEYIDAWDVIRDQQAKITASTRQADMFEGGW